MHHSLPIAPSGSPRNVSAVPVNATALLLEWLPPPLEQQNGIIVEYTISLTDVLTNTSKLLLTNSTSEYVVTELHPFYQYEIQIAATTIQTGPLSDLVSIQMPESGIAYNVVQPVTILLYYTVSCLIQSQVLHQ